MKIAIRMDDITPDMDWTKFFRFKEMCDSYQVKPLLGVVPDNQDELLHVEAPRADFWEYLLQLQTEGWCIAQHGVSHRYMTKKMGCFPLNRLSEFAGMKYEEQYTALKKGQDVLRLHGIETDLFMAPAHSFDRDTIKALKELGFQGLTDGFGRWPYRKWGMVFYPISYRQSSALEKENGYTTFVVHVNTMEEKDFKRYERIFMEYKDRMLPYKDLLKIQPRRRGIFGSMKEYLMAFMKFAIIRIKAKRR